MRPTLPLLLLLAACSAPPSGPVIVDLHAPAWIVDASAGWDAAAEPAVLHAVAHAPLGRDRDAAAQQAEHAARTQLAARLTEAAARLRTTFRDQHATQLQPAQLDALVAVDAAARAVITQAAAGAQLKGQWVDDESFSVWLAVDAATTLLPALEADLATRLVPLARELTPADRQALSDELVRFVAEHHGR